MTQPQTTHTEEVAGKRADYLVYYRRNGKLFFDAIWAPSAEVAEQRLLDMAKQLRWRHIAIVRVEVRL